MHFSRITAITLVISLFASCASVPTQQYAKNEAQADKSFTKSWTEKLNETPSRKPANLLKELFPQKDAHSFNSKELLEISSSEKLGVKKAHLIIDNDEGFRTKLEAIRSAKAGETIRMAYYIYNPDHSSALIYAELLQAAARGVKVKILADLLTNYLYLDLFRLLSASPNVEIRFYGRPSKLVLRDVKFLSMPCPESPEHPSSTYCSDAKWKKIQEPYSSQDFFGKALLAGMLAKDPTALKIGFLMGQEIDIKKYMEGSQSSPEEKKQLLELLELVYDWKVKGETLAGIKSRFAMLMYGAKINPVLNELFGRIPLSQIGEKSVKDWEHVTDFTHHKLLMVGDRFLQLGGRNIENSYHMEPNPLIHRYVFKDVDIALELNDGGDSVIRSYEDLFNFSPMVISLKDLLKLAPNDLVANEKAVDSAYAKCSAGSPKREAFLNCMHKTTASDSNYLSSEQRIENLKNELTKKMQQYNEYASEPREVEHWSKDGSDLVPASDLKNATIAYLENVPYDRSLPKNSRKRIYGTRHGFEKQDGKYIHYAWSRGLQNACVQAQKSDKEVRVVLHSAYFLPPASMIQDMTKMFDGTWNCNNVRVTILSNSFETTDLNVVNALGQYQMTAFFNIYSQADSLFPNSKNRRAKFEYYEYKKFKGGDDISLHKKLHVMGNDVFVGSANGDVRSYYMDSNNGIYLQNVPKFAAEYVAWVDSLLKNSKTTTNRTQDFIGNGEDISSMLLSMHKEDVEKVEAYLAKKGWYKNLDADIKAKIYEKLEDAGKLVFDLTRKIMSPMYVDGGSNEGQKALGQKKAADQFNRMMQLL